MRFCEGPSSRLRGLHAQAEAAPLPRTPAEGVRRQGSAGDAGRVSAAVGSSAGGEEGRVAYHATA